MDNKIQLELIINGLKTKAEYYQSDVDEIFIPLLKELTQRQKKVGKRIVAFIAAPPGLGKSTLVTYLEMLSKTVDGVTEVQAAGMDGFHHYSEYLKHHETTRDGKKILMDEIKGAPETFDVERMDTFLQRLLSEKEIMWPTYDRTKHDVVDEGYVLDKDIILLEGNYLLLNDERWKCLKKYAEYTIYAYTDIEILKPRLIDRKVASGYDRAEAEAFYDFSDGRNAKLVLEDRPDADLYLKYIDGHWRKEKQKS